MNLVNTILNLDRRIIYTIVALSVAVPLLKPLSLPITPTQEVLGIYDVMNELPAGSHVLIAGDFDPASKPELMPMLEAVLAHCFERDLRPHLLTLWPAGPGLMQYAIERQAAAYNKESGKDYVFLGFRYGSAAVILGMVGSVTGTFTTDFYGQATADMPIFEEINKFADYDYMIDIAAGATVELWIAYAAEPENVPIGASCTAVSATGYYPYLQAEQITGLAGGMKGTAEYEVLLAIDFPNIAGDASRPRPTGAATKGMDAQSMVHLFIVLSIVVANICYYISARRERATRREA
ncbi:hypothetical protein IIA79_01500 [bacterium]|nr:hypothetical protein [bacterium]